MVQSSATNWRVAARATIAAIQSSPFAAPSARFIEDSRKNANRGQLQPKNGPCEAPRRASWVCAWSSDDSRRHLRALLRFCVLLDLVLLIGRLFGQSPLF